MELRRIHRALIITLIAGVSLLLSAECIAQDSQDSSSVIWWIVGSGGALDAVNSDGDTVSCTVGQTAIDSTAIRDSSLGETAFGSPSRSMTVSLGFWLPRGATSNESQPVTGVEDVFALTNRPNPFTHSTTVSYLLPIDGHVRLDISDASGKRVRLLVNEAAQAGAHVFVFDGRDDAGGPISSGSYFYTLELIWGTGQSKKSVSGIMNFVK